MPNYDFACEKHGIQEFFYLSYLDKPTYELCHCGMMMQQVWVKAPGMQPDSLWAGNVVNGQYVTSKTQLKAIMDAKGHAFYESGVDKDIDRNYEYRKESEQKARRLAIEEGLKDINDGDLLSLAKSYPLKGNTPNEPVKVEMTE